MFGKNYVAENPADDNGGQYIDGLDNMRVWVTTDVGTDRRQKDASRDVNGTPAKWLLVFVALS